VPIVPTEQVKHVSNDGAATISIPYEMRGLYSGIWLIFVSIAVSGKHELYEFPLIIPKVIYPGENGNKWWLDFDVTQKK
jgi:hypothetical protein